MATVKELREQAYKRTAAASAKVRRLKQQGVNIAGSEFDVRATRDKLSRLNRKQLQSYMERVNSFTNRNTKFVAGAEGAPLPKHLVAQYQSAERRRNERLAAHVAQYSDLPIGDTGITVGQRQDNLDRKTNTMLHAGGSGYSPYSPHTRSPEGFASAKALRGMIEAERKAGRTAAINANLTAQQLNHVEWLEQSGADKMAQTMASLTPEQFDILRNHTDYYQHIRFLYLGKEEAAESEASKMRDDNLAEARELTDWANALYVDKQTGRVSSPRRK